MRNDGAGWSVDGAEQVGEQAGPIGGRAYFQVQQSAAEAEAEVEERAALLLGGGERGLVPGQTGRPSPRPSVDCLLKQFDGPVDVVGGGPPAQRDAERTEAADLGQAHGAEDR
jgi:hypothetical protein